MDKIFSRLVQNEFSELVGLTVDATVRLPENLVNELIQEELRGNKNISSVQVAIHRENRVSVNLRTPMWPWPLNLKLRLFGSVDLTGSPKVRAFLENNVLLGKLGSLFKRMPPGITLHEDQVSVDFAPFLKPEHKKFLPLVKSIDIRSDENKLILDVKLKR